MQMKTTCPLDCPDACSLDVRVEAGRLHTIDGDKSDAFTNGAICGKVRRFADHVYCDERLLRPAKRIAPKSRKRNHRHSDALADFEPCTWDEAYDLIVERIKEACEKHGAESILPLCYGGSNGKLTQDTVDASFFYRMGASHLERAVCAAPSSAAYQGVYGAMPGVALPDYVHSKLIVVWGNNPHATGMHFVRYVLEAQRKGARLVVIDPRRTKLARIADLHLPIFPGTDLPVALAMIRWLAAEGHADCEFLSKHTSGYQELLQKAEPWSTARAAQVARIAPDDLRTLFEWYAESQPAVIRCGWGPERNRNGGSAIAAILAIPAIANKFCRGGGFTMSQSGAWQGALGAAIQATPPATRRINMNRLGEWLLRPQGTPIDVLFVYNCNPVATLPEQNKVIAGLQRDDLFTVVFDQVMTDTAHYADLILPATTFLEHHDLRRGYGYPRLGDVRPVIDRQGQAKPNYEVFGELIQRLGKGSDGDRFDAESLRQQVLGDRANAEQPWVPPGGLDPVQMQDVHPRTPSGKIELFPKCLSQESSAGLFEFISIDDGHDAKYPLALISPAVGDLVNSTFGQLQKKSAMAQMHPEDAAARKLTSDQKVRVFNDSGEVVLGLQVDANVRKGMVAIPKGIWCRATENGQTSNALSPDTLSDIGAGACFNDARVEVEATVSAPATG